MRRSATVAAFFVCLAACALAGQGLSGAASPVTIPPPGPTLSFRADFTPRVLPKRARVPVRLRIAGEVEGATNPTLQELRLDIDRSFAFDLGPLSTCGGSRLDRPSERIGGGDTPDEIRARCRSAIVAGGTAEFLLSFPENTPIPVLSDLTLFKGNSRSGSTALFLYAYLTIPTPRAIVAPVEMKKVRDGRYGTRATISIPTIAGGYGRLTSFSLTIPRRTPHAGRPLSLARLRCADGKAQIQAQSTFADGARTNSTAIRTCSTAPGT